MAKIYTRDEVKELLKGRFPKGEVFQTELDYNDEYNISFWEDEKVVDLKKVEVVSTMTAIKNEADFGDGKEFLLNVIEALLNEEELLKIGAYAKLADDLFWRAL